MLYIDENGITRKTLSRGRLTDFDYTLDQISQKIQRVRKAAQTMVDIIARVRN